MTTARRVPVGHGQPDQVHIPVVRAHRVPLIVLSRTDPPVRPLSGRVPRVRARDVLALIAPVLIVLAPIAPALIAPVLIVLAPIAPAPIARRAPASTSRATIARAPKALDPIVRPLRVRFAAKVEWNGASQPAAGCRAQAVHGPTTSQASPAAENPTAAPTRVPASEPGPVAAADRQVVAPHSLGQKVKIPAHVRRGPSLHALKVRRSSVPVPPSLIPTPPPARTAKVANPGSPRVPAVHGPSRVGFPSPAASRAAHVPPVAVPAALRAERSATSTLTA